LIVSGFKTSPNDLSRISSGEERLIETFEKLIFALLSFLNAIILIKIIKTEPIQFRRDFTPF
jgi:hypothetical protein